MSAGFDPTMLPADLPVPIDDGAAAHLAGMRIPSVALAATDGTRVDLSTLPGLVVVFAYPRTGRPNEPSLVDDWDEIPGARGCTTRPRARPRAAKSACGAATSGCTCGAATLAATSAAATTPRTNTQRSTIAPRITR